MQDGTSPYHGQSNPDVMKMVLSGGRHPKPSNDCCTDELYTFMLQCWHHDVAQRPTFAKVVEYIKPAAVIAAEDEGNTNRGSSRERKPTRNSTGSTTSTTTWGLTTTARRVTRRFEFKRCWGGGRRYCIEPNRRFKRGRPSGWLHGHG